jgi:DNA segregation ATPase FtsK/SpoIIIE, S-DNA-T family
MSLRASSRTSARGRRAEPASRGREIGGIVLLAVGLFSAASLLSLQLGDGSLMGPLGRTWARLLYAFAGAGSHLLPVLMVVAAVRILAGRPMVRTVGEGAGLALGLVSLAILLHLVGHRHRVHGIGPGGVLGEYLAEVLRAVVSTAGTALAACMGLFLALAVTTGFRMAGVVALVGRALAAAARGVGHLLLEIGRFWLEVFRAVLPERDPEPEDDSDQPEPTPPPVATDAEAEDTEDEIVRLGDPRDPVILMRKGRRKKPPAAAEDTTAVPVAPKDEDDDRTVVNETAPAPASASGPLIVEPSFQKAASKEMKEKEKQVAENRPDYRLPAVSLLKYDDAGVHIDKDAMLELSARLVKTLGDYGVKGEVTAIRPGPVVTMYEFAPAPGTRVSKIANLADDLAMALEAIRVRIVAPIPGKAAVGIEVPNRARETVYLKEIIADDVFQRAKSKLTLALGKDIEGRPVAVDLGKMPHLLVAGTTGAGKSVSVNAMIMSLLYNATPEDVRMIMVDPKMLELSMYEGIPHLLLPVVTDPKKANLALRWAVEEMERRYEILAEAGVRDIASYNRKVAKRADSGPVELTVEDDQGNVLETVPVQMELPTRAPSSPGGGAAAPATRLPYIVVVIDEFADLMMCAPKDVETSVARIAQKARAAGIHLLLATQRPSVDVITGLIKANFPSRIAFQVTSKIDSRTILDQGGAEALLGQGDMLFSDRGGALRRVHGCLVQDEEIQKVVEFLRRQGKPVYDLEILRPRDEDEGGDSGVEDEDFSDELYDRAVALVAETRQASISMIQRRLRIGYNRAARMVERMEREGVVGPADGPNRREVLIQPTA